MGLYFQPPLPFLGCRQPYEPKKLTPPSGPAAQNPPFIGAKIPAAVRAWWDAPAPPLPALPEYLTFAAPAAGPPARSLDQRAILSWWTQAAILPPRRVSLTPSGPAAQNPPLLGTRALLRILDAWTPLPVWMPRRVLFTASASVSLPAGPTGPAAWGHHGWGRSAYAGPAAAVTPAGTSRFEQLIAQPDGAHVYAVEIWPYKS